MILIFKNQQKLVHFCANFYSFFPHWKWSNLKRKLISVAIAVVVVVIAGYIVGFYRKQTIACL